AEVLSSHPKLNIQLLGGTLQKEHRFLYGTSVVEKLPDYHVDKVFIGVVGISDGGLTNVHEVDGDDRLKMEKQADQVILVADHTKLGVNGLFRCADLQDVDILNTDRAPPATFRELLDRHNVELLTADQDKEGVEL